MYMLPTCISVTSKVRKMALNIVVSCCSVPQLYKYKVRESTQTLEIPSYYGSDMNDEDDEEEVIMTQNPAYILEKDFFPEITDSAVQMYILPTCISVTSKVRKMALNIVVSCCSVPQLYKYKVRESTQTPEIPPYYGSDMNDEDDEEEVIMTQNPAYILEKDFFPEITDSAVQMYMLPTCISVTSKVRKMALNIVVSCCSVPQLYKYKVRESTQTPEIPSYYGSDMNDEDDEEEEVIMTQNPTYILEKDFFPEITDSAVQMYILPTCISVTSKVRKMALNIVVSCCSVPQLYKYKVRESTQTPEILSYYGSDMNDEDDEEEEVIMTQNPTYILEKDFFPEITDSAVQMYMLPTCISVTSKVRKMALNIVVSCCSVPQLYKYKVRESTQTPEIPSYYGSDMNDEDDEEEVIMTQNPAYILEKDFSPEITDSAVQMYMLPTCISVTSKVRKMALNIVVSCCSVPQLYKYKVRESTQTPEIPSYYGSDMNDEDDEEEEVIMTQIPLTY